MEDNTPPSEVHPELELRFNRLWDAHRDSQTVVDFALHCPVYEEIKDIFAGAKRIWSLLISLEAQAKTTSSRNLNGSNDEFHLDAEWYREWLDRSEEQTRACYYRWSDQKHGRELIELANASSRVLLSHGYIAAGSGLIPSTTVCKAIAHIAGKLSNLFFETLNPLLYKTEHRFDWHEDLAKTGIQQCCKRILGIFKDLPGVEMSAVGSLLVTEEYVTVNYLTQNLWLRNVKVPRPVSVPDYITIEDVRLYVARYDVELQLKSMGPYTKKWGTPAIPRRGRGGPAKYLYSAIRPYLVKDWENVVWPIRWDVKLEEDLQAGI